MNIKLSNPMIVHTRKATPCCSGNWLVTTMTETKTAKTLTHQAIVVNTGVRKWVKPMPGKTGDVSDDVCGVADRTSCWEPRLHAFFFHRPFPAESLARCVHTLPVV